MSADRSINPRSEREQPDEQAAESFRLLVERVKDYAIFLMDREGVIASWNEGLERIKGYSASEIIGQRMSIFYTPEDLARGLPQHLLRVARSEGRVENEGWRVRKDGTLFWANVVITALRDDAGTLVGFGTVTRDLTERRRADTALAELSGRLIQLQDEERQRIGRKLLDTTSPLLTSLIGRLYTARQRREAGADLGPLLDEALGMAEATVTMVRDVSSMLHPQMLEQSGLLATLKWYLDTFAKRNGVRVDAQLPDSMARMSHEREIAMFRLTQEWLDCLLGVGTKEVRFRVTVSAQELAMRILALDGNWPQELLDELKAGRGELGVTYTATRERLRQLGGTLDIKPREGGAALGVRLPLGKPPRRG
jgi:PAS domain S-box-containing protein